MHDTELTMPDELMVREVAFYYLAASHTSVHTLVHATNELFTWCNQHDDAPIEIVATRINYSDLCSKVCDCTPLAPRPGAALKQRSLWQTDSGTRWRQGSYRPANRKPRCQRVW